LKDCYAQEDDQRPTGTQADQHTGAAAIDIGSKMHMAAVNPACADMPVRAFGISRKICMSLRIGSKPVA
jgi:urease beta subunit